MESANSQPLSGFNFNEEEVKYNPVMGTLKIPNVKTLHYCPNNVCGHREFLRETKEGWEYLCPKCGETLKIFKLRYNKQKKSWNLKNEFLTKEEMEI